MLSRRVYLSKSLIFPIYIMVDLFTKKQVPKLVIFIALEKLPRSFKNKLQLRKIRKICKLHLNLEIESLAHFQTLPIMTKQDLPVEPRFPGKTYRKHETSGSTGQPRVIWVPSKSWERKDAIFMRSWLKMGWRGDKILRLISGEPRYRFYDSLRNVTPLNYKTIDESYVDWFLQNRPFLIHGPGGSIRELCEKVIAAGHAESLKDLKIHWCSESSERHKERLLDFVRDFHEQYGLAELPTVGATDGKGELRIVEEQGFIEIVDDEGEPIGPHQEGYIVVTDFNNYQTPIIRYKSGDRGKWKIKKDNAGRPHRILYDIIGRAVDFYDGPEVKRPIGWWVVAPISHELGHVIEKWRCEIRPKEQLLILYVKFQGEEDFEKLSSYREWVRINVGLKTEFRVDDYQYDAYWKNKLVRVVY